MAEISVGDLLKKYIEVRKHSVDICKPLKTEDYVPQPIELVSPPKWHLGHVTWFFETMVLKSELEGYKEFNPRFSFVFNSYYESVGPRVKRENRGTLSRPTVEDTYAYRRQVDEGMDQYLQHEISPEMKSIIITGLNHEQQHQELLITDIKYILGNNPLYPAYGKFFTHQPGNNGVGYTKMPGGLYEIGYKGDGFCYDNELQAHQVYLQDYEISNRLVTNGDYLEFINAGGYKKFNYWHMDGWAWVNNNHIEGPLYWHKADGKWYEYTLEGLQPLDKNAILRHISYFEAFAYAQWKGLRLPTEFEWEAAAAHLNWGARWEWTESSYLPYPGFQKLPGALGEYNGKFMVSQKVLRGGSVATPDGHSRKTYRNYFYPDQRWQYTGIRLAK